MTTTVVHTIRSAGGDYTSLSAWEAAQQRNLVAADQIAVAECYNDWPTGLYDHVTVSGWTTDATRYVKITVAPGHRHNGVPHAGFWMRYDQNFAPLVFLDQAYTVVEWLDVETTSNYSNVVEGNNATAPAGMSVRNVLAKAPAGQGACFIGCLATTINCVARGGGTGFISANFWFQYNYGCVATGCTNGFTDNTSYLRSILINCVSIGNTANFYGANFRAECANNATGSATDDAPGANSIVGVNSAAFANYAEHNFHLAAGSPLIGAGVNLYATYPADWKLDMDGDTLPSSGAWNIGPDYAAASPVNRRALLCAAGRTREIADAELGTGLKPLVIHAGRIAQRVASEGQPLVCVAGRVRAVLASETLLI